MSPTYRQAEEIIDKLEGGAEALLFASGLAAATSLFKGLSKGDHVVIPSVMYYALRVWVKDFAERWGLTYTEFDPTAPGKQSDRVWVERPSNPTWDVTDIAEAARLAHAAGAQLAVIDGGDAVAHAADRAWSHYVMHSATKYLNGHSDVIAAGRPPRMASGLPRGFSPSRRHRIGSIAGGMYLCAVSRQFEHFASHEKVDLVVYPGLGPSGT